MPGCTVVTPRRVKLRAIGAGVFMGLCMAVESAEMVFARLMAGRSLMACVLTNASRSLPTATPSILSNQPVEGKGTSGDVLMEEAMAIAADAMGTDITGPDKTC